MCQQSVRQPHTYIHNQFDNLRFVAIFSYQFSMIIQKSMDYDNLLFDTLYFENLEAKEQ